MSTPILATKLYAPPPRPNLIARPRLVARLEEGLHGAVTLISASAGFGKTTLLSEWLAVRGRPAAWLSLDAGDGEAARFLAYLIAALRTVAPQIGEGALAALRSPQPPPAEALVVSLLNEAAALPGQLILVLDDYHAVDSQQVDAAVALLIERLPPQLHLVIATREDPSLPLPRLRARGQLSELRVADLRFTTGEAEAFLNHAMGLSLAPGDVGALDARTEGWAAGLQMAALSLQGRESPAEFIASFTGNHRFVLDYLVEEVLGRQPARVQGFLMRTAILDRLCGPLCDALLRDPSIPGAEMLAALERANLFVTPLDDERRWYRYHHLFADLLRRRQGVAAPPGEGQPTLSELHARASAWYESEGLDAEAFEHAVAAGDLDRAARLVEGGGMPLFFRGAITPVVRWLQALSPRDLEARPALLVMYASALLFIGQMGAVEQKLQAAEAALDGAALDARSRDLIGHIASIRATLAVGRHDPEAIVAESRRALDYLSPENLPVRTATTWALGYAHQMQGDRAAAARAFTEAADVSEAIGHQIIAILARIGLGILHEGDLQLELAAGSYRRALELAGEPPILVACEAHLGLARVAYARGDLGAARGHGLRAAELARQIERTDRSVACEIFLARLSVAEGDLDAAAVRLAAAGQAARQQQFVLRLPEVAAAQVDLLLRQGNLPAAALLARAHDIPVSRARVRLAQGDADAALALVQPVRRAAERRGWADERLQALLLEALALQAHGDQGGAVALVGGALALAEPGGMTQIFLDEGPPMARLLAEVVARRVAPGSAARVLALFGGATPPAPPAADPLIEPLSDREREVLRLVAQGLSNQEISERLVLALSTVKGHNQRIFEKLQVQRRTEAVARARELGLLQEPPATTLPQTLL